MPGAAQRGQVSSANISDRLKFHKSSIHENEIIDLTGASDNEGLDTELQRSNGWDFTLGGGLLPDEKRQPFVAPLSEGTSQTQPRTYSKLRTMEVAPTSARVYKDEVTNPQRDDVEANVNQQNFPFPDRFDRLYRHNVSSTLLKDSAHMSATIDSTEMNAGLAVESSKAMSTLQASKVRETSVQYWDGTGHEDDLSELVIKNGYQEKVPVPSEFSSARSVIWPSLKPRSGLQALSFMFTSALYRRRENSRVTLAPMFRPPPRITLGDTKREAWLLDLANEDVSLRRLCRTIPHGIQGLQLLNECASRRIPLSRALWFIKCVGANELRSFRRKGVTEVLLFDNETKWIVDWTKAVESFLFDSLDMGSSNDIELFERSTYSIRLCCGLHMEGLLDRDHFMVWISEQLQTGRFAQLPLIMLIVRSIWPAMIADLRYGCQVATAAFERVKQLSLLSLAQPVVKSLQHGLLEILQHMTLARPQCILLSGWKSDDITFVLPLIEDRRHEWATILQRLGKRAFSYTKLFPYIHDASSQPEQNLKQALDSLSLVLFLIGWASSTFIGSIAKVYLVARMITFWRREGVDTDEAILSVLPTIRRSKSCQGQYIARLICELIVSGSFDCGRYLTRLIAVGGLMQPNATMNPDLNILLQMPMEYLTANVSSLRSMLLRSVRVSIDDQIEDIAKFKVFLQTRITSIASGTLDEPKQTYMKHACQLLRFSSIRQLSTWLKEHVVSSFNAVALDATKIASTREPRLELLLFTSRVLGALGDLSAYADILSQIIDSCSQELLSSVVSLLDLRLKDFAYLGKARELYDLAIHRYCVLRKHESSSKDLVTRLLQLSAKVGCSHQNLKFMRSEFVMNEHDLGIAAYTPGSDSSVDVKSMKSVSSTLEKLLITSDLSDLGVTLRSVVRYATVSEEDTVTIFNALISTMRRLKVLNHQSIDEVVRQWIFETLQDSIETEFLLVIASAIESETITMETLLGYLEESYWKQVSQEPSQAERIAVIILQFILEPEHLIEYSSEKTLHLWREDDFKSSDCLISILIGSICRQGQTCLNVIDYLKQYKSSQVWESRLLDIFLRRSGTVLRCLDLLHYDSGVVAAQSLLALLEIVVKQTHSPSAFNFASESDEHPGSASTVFENLRETIRLFFRSVDSLSLSTYQLILRMLTSVLTKFDDSKECLVEAIVDCVESAVAQDLVLSNCLLSAVDRTVMTACQRKLERLLLDQLLEAALVRSSISSDLRQMERRLAAIEAVLYAPTISNRDEDAYYDSIQFSAEAIRCLEIYMEWLESKHFNKTEVLDAELSAQQESFTFRFFIQQKLHFLLRMIVIHERNYVNDANSLLERLLSSLCTILSLRLPSIDHWMCLLITDLAAMFSLRAPMSLRKAIFSQFFETSRVDDRIRFLLGDHDPYQQGWLRIFIQQKNDQISLHGAEDPTTDPTLQADTEVLGIGEAESSTSVGALGTKTPQSDTREVTDTFPSNLSESLSINHRFLMRRWEMLTDSTLNIGTNDTAISLRLFDARRAS